ncbi:MAG: class I SAM-dependent methyltransferase [Deltaproteobacteria bacterium]|nr:class I SAM-dependent methyltransferase [Deltaproteobacteria bacterium]MBI3294451.1 class I SAM-dependent methyltransferase [Deltaproteobacteria bacterium]
MEVVDSKDVGLAIGQILGAELFGFEDLHYGLWTDSLAPTLRNFAEAQERYSLFLLNRIPPGVKTILDVGAGSGKQAERLIARGYNVDCVSPSLYLSAKIQERLGEKVTLYPSTIESCEPDRKYDLVLFSESFQYVNMELALKKAISVLNPGGHILISDFFKKTAGPEGPLGGGHFIGEFRGLLERLPMTLVSDQDITTETAPTMGMFGQLLDTTARPVKDIICRFIESRHPSLYKFLAWKFRIRFAKLDSKYFQGTLTAESFSQYKTYRLLLLQKRLSH